MWPSGPFYILSEVESSPTRSDSGTFSDGDVRTRADRNRKLLTEKKECSYQERLRRWEARERRMARKYAKRKEQENEKLLQQIKLTRAAKAFLETYDDHIDDPAFYNAVTMLRKLQDRVQEQSLDEQDRLSERKELEELRTRLKEDCAAAPRNRQTARRKPWCSGTKNGDSRSPPPGNGLAKMDNVRAWQTAGESKSQARTNSGVLVPVGSQNGRAPASHKTKEAVVSTSTSYEDPSSVPYSPTMPADPRLRSSRSSKASSSNASFCSSHSSSRKSVTKVKVRVVAEPSASGESISSGEVDFVVFGCRRNANGNVAVADKKEGEVCDGKDEMQRLLNESSLTISSPEDGGGAKGGGDGVGGGGGGGGGDANGVKDDDKKPTNGVSRAAGNEGNGKATGRVPHSGGSSSEDVGEMSHQDKLRYIESLIPARRDALFRYRVDPRLMDKDMVKRHILPWVHRKVVEFTGRKQPTLEKCLYDMLRKGSGPSELLVHVFPVFREDAERFVVRLWRLVIYKTECKKMGVLRK